MFMNYEAKHKKKVLFINYYLMLIINYYLMRTSVSNLVSQYLFLKGKILCLLLELFPCKRISVIYMSTCQLIKSIKYEKGKIKLHINRYDPVQFNVNKILCANEYR